LAQVAPQQHVVLILARFFMTRPGGLTYEHACRKVRMPDFVSLGSSSTRGWLSAIVPDRRCKMVESPPSSFGCALYCHRAAWPQHGRTRHRRAAQTKVAADVACSEVHVGAVHSVQHGNGNENEDEACTTYDRQSMLRWLSTSDTAPCLPDSSRLVSVTSKKRCQVLARFRTPTWEVPLMTTSSDQPATSCLEVDLKKSLPAIPVEASVKTEDCARRGSSSISDFDASGSHFSPATAIAIPCHHPSRPSKAAAWRGSRENMRGNGMAASPDASNTTGEEQLEHHPSKMQTFIGLLNKISARNEETIVKQLRLLSPSNMQELCKMAELMIQQALRDPLRGDLYGRTITSLSIVFPQFSSPRQRSATRPRPVSFAAQVVQCLEKEFDGFCRDLEAPLGEKDDRKTEVSEIFEACQPVKDCALACVDFVGKLVLCDVLSERLLSNVVLRLLWRKERRPEDPPPASFIECACKLLSITVGPLRWREREPEALQLVLGRLACLKDMHLASHNRTFVYPKRVRYIVLDLLEAHAVRRDTLSDDSTTCSTLDSLSPWPSEAEEDM